MNKPMSTDEARVIVNTFLKDAMTKLRLEFASRMKQQLRIDPELKRPCADCAFRTNTDGHEGFDTTAIKFIHALGTWGLFACHYTDRAEGENYRPRIDDEGFPITCAAWDVLMDDPKWDVRDLLGAELVDGIIEVSRKQNACVMPEWVE